MEGNRRWLGWIAIGISGLALLVALFGRGFGPLGAAAGLNGSNAPQSYAQQGAGPQAAGPQSGATGPGANTQQGGATGPGANAQQGGGRQGNGPQGGANAQQGAGPQAAGPGANTQQGAGSQAAGPRSGAAGAGADARRGPGQPGDTGFGLSGWLRFPFKLISSAFQMGMLALLVVLGLWLIRGRSAGGAPGSVRAEPAQGPTQEPLSPTGESYSDEQ